VCKAKSYISTLSAIIIAVVGLAACGGSASGEAVVRVGGRSISKATLDHWIPIEAILTYDLSPRKPVPKGVVPVPPDYTACIAFLKSTPQKLVQSGPKPTVVQLKSQCRQRYQMLKQTVLRFLITTEWLIDEGAEQGLKVTDKEIIQRYEQVKKIEFPKNAEFERHLALIGETVADQLFRSKVKLLVAKIEQKFVYKKGLTVEQQQQALGRFVKEFPKKWAARTSCRAGYVVPGCEQYKGPEPPEIRI
jgi:foldase protein PrsA